MEEKKMTPDLDALERARDDLDKLFIDKNPYFNVAHHRQAKFLTDHKDAIRALLDEAISNHAKKGEPENGQ